MNFPYKLYKDARGNVHHLLQGDPNPDWVEFTPDPNPPIPTHLYVPPYGARRTNAYPVIGEQLDMLWHELNTNGSISSNGEWFNAIKEVKEAHPKP